MIIDFIRLSYKKKKKKFVFAHIIIQILKDLQLSCNRSNQLFSTKNQILAYNLYNHVFCCSKINNLYIELHTFLIWYWIFSNHNTVDQ